MLDWACGSGRHAVFLAKLGAKVTAIDKDQKAIEEARAHGDEAGVEVEWVITDLERYEAAAEQYDAVLVFNYLDRDRFAVIQESVRPGGLVFAETFLNWQRGLGWGPTRDEFLLEPGELAQLAAPFEVLHSREVLETFDDRTRAVASIIARRLDE